MSGNAGGIAYNDMVITTTGSGAQMAPCWLTLDGPWLFSSNSPSQSVSRYLVYGTEIIQKEAVSASFDGEPTDIAYNSGSLAVVDGAVNLSHLSVFHVDGDGNLIRQSVTTIAAPINGIMIIGHDDE